MHRTALGLAVALVLVSSVAASALEFPKAFQGVWTDSAQTCDALKNKYRVGPDNVWIRISGDQVSGTMTGKLTKIVGQQKIHYQEVDSTVESEITLRRDGFLEERVIGARASMVYLRCK